MEQTPSRSTSRPSLDRAWIGALLLAAGFALYYVLPVERWPALNATLLVAAVAALAIRSFGKSYRALGRARAAEDLPTSTIRGAAQGYVEFEGDARPAGDPLHCPIGDARCLWWEYSVLENLPFRKELRKVAADSSSDPFILEDATGHFYVAPAGVQVLGVPSVRWHGWSRLPESIPPLSLRVLSNVLLWPAFNLPARILLFVIVAEVLLRAIVLGPSALTGTGTLLLAYCVVSMTVFRFRYEVRVLPLAVHLFALGEFNSRVLQVDGRAVEALTRPGVDGQPFVLSTRPQARYARRSHLRALISLAVLVALAVMAWRVYMNWQQFMELRCAHAREGRHAPSHRP